MSDTQDFLVEIGTEELPPRALRRLSEVFGTQIRTGLDEAGLAYGDVALFATPRRLAVQVAKLQARQEDRKTESRGPPVKIAFDDAGEPTRAALAFAGKCGVGVGDLEQVETAKGAWLMHRGTETGQPAEKLLPAIVMTALEKLPIPKRMRWGAREAEFVRPVHWIVMLLGSQVVPARLFELDSDRYTRGHRFHAPDAIEISRPSDYSEKLQQRGHVLPDFSVRRERIETDVQQAAAQAGGQPVSDAALLDEVTALVEWPVAVSATFDERFLELPEEVLIETLQAHQRYFPIRGKDGLLPEFVTVSNIESKDPDQVRSGNERVVRPRLADAAFFWDSDRRTPLAERTAALAGVVFQKKLGTLKDKASRVEQLTQVLADPMGADRKLCARAATLGKCDLLTDMVGEFPSLQGTMGRYYATHDGETEEVAVALEEQYLPRFAGDLLPSTATGAVLSAAEKLDTLAGIFAIGQRPTGTRDPFALRRSALGLLRLLIEKQYDADVPALIHVALDLQPVDTDRQAMSEEIYTWLLERLRSYYLDDPDAGITVQMFDAVAARRPASPLDFHQRLQAVRSFSQLDAAEALAAANKRIANILRSADDDIPPAAQADLLHEAAEKALHSELERMHGEVMPLLSSRKYADALTRLAALRPAVDHFFDDVLVMAEDKEVRRNRLALLSQLRSLFLHTADLSRLQVG
ncbi:MAG: glycine--tRNA ligase subunit beta [Gammaproteobacteria bacterium]|nr:glycine--tRNA ligase subunit beta [Gammaproteobacteria bacterium]NNF60131.1 glycine--tRNA ligase subunit beta [Gammaproteobacteria bacterium]NNM21543.1 glycine--tRNA ligase subunit beta [Gammaproteobacteria bacterium]